MWLLDTKTITLSQHSDDDVRYAILSHRWGNDDDEVSFADIQKPRVARRKKGYKKIQRCCEQALRNGYKYVWVDTCCIDKSSSAELQEAINSMYRWYDKSGVCYAYLQDVPSVPLEKSEWFTRGWTLQELLAPKVVQFFDESWSYLGDQHTLVESIHEATSIDEEVVTKYRNLFNCSIAQRMSWAASRKTKRVEDRAYSLFGIFQVHLPMLYGEREAAFQRLQQAILRTSEDDSLFAWTGVSDSFGGLLAPNLEAFKIGAQVSIDGMYGSWQKVSGSDATERSIGITTKLIPWTTDTYLVLLGCKALRDGEYRLPGIYLRALGDGIYARIEVSGVDIAYLSTREWQELLKLGAKELITPYKGGSRRPWAVDRLISVRQLPLLPYHEFDLKKQIYGFRVLVPARRILPYPVEISKYLQRPEDDSYTPATNWDSERRIMSVANGTFLDKGIVGALQAPHYQHNSERISQIRDIHLGFDHHFNPTLYIRKESATAKNENIDSFCAWSDEDADEDLSASPCGTSLTHSSKHEAQALDEAHFWNEFNWSIDPMGYIVEDRPERDFWAIKGNREWYYTKYLLVDIALQIELERVEMESGMIWQISMSCFPRSVQDIVL